MKQNNPNHPIPLAVIDIGSNTLRLLIGYIYEGKVNRISINRSVTRLGKDILSTGRLNTESVNESIKSLIKFKGIIDTHKANKIVAIGTSALREASNSEEFLATVYNATGIKIAVISGDREAELTKKGILEEITGNNTDSSMPTVIIDIGGGSTEWIICKGGCIKGSIPLGAVKLHETYIKHDPPAADELREMKLSIHEQFVRILPVEAIGLQGRLIATGGTAAMLAVLDMELAAYNSDKIHLHRITFSDLVDIYKKLSVLSNNERAAIKGMEPERADIIVPGMLIIIAIMEIYGFNEVIVSDHGLLEGILRESAFQGIHE